MGPSRSPSWAATTSTRRRRISPSAMHGSNVPCVPPVNCSAGIAYYRRRRSIYFRSGPIGRFVWTQTCVLGSFGIGRDVALQLVGVCREELRRHDRHVQELDVVAAAL